MVRLSQWSYLLQKVKLHSPLFASRHQISQPRSRTLRSPCKVVPSTSTIMSWNSSVTWTTRVTRTNKTGRGTKPRILVRSSFRTTSRSQVCSDSWCTVFRREHLMTAINSVTMFNLSIGRTTVSHLASSTKDPLNHLSNLNLYPQDSIRCLSLKHLLVSRFLLLLRMTPCQTSSMPRQCLSTLQFKRSTLATSRQSALASLSSCLR